MFKRVGIIFAGLVFLGLTNINAATPLNAVILADDPEGNMGGARVKVLHASPDAPAVDVWVNGSVVFSNLAFEESSEFAEVPAGTYTVAVSPTGMSEPIVIGPVDLELAAETDYLVVATDMLSMITPVILTADGSTPAEGNAWVRFLHASPDAPAVDIAVADGGPVLLPNVSFQSFTEYAPVPAGTYDLEARIAGTMDVALSLPGIAVADGGVYTAVATGLVADIGALDNFYFVPAAARAGGVGDSFFITDVDVNNAGDMLATYKVLWLPRDTDNAAPIMSDEVTIGPGETTRWSDVLGTVFGVPDGTDAVGALAFISDSDDLLFFSRTFNQSDAGTFGQAIPGIAADDLIPANEMKRILFFTENSSYRSNIGILNGTGSPMTIKWRRYTADGMMVDESMADLPAWGNVQLNRVFGAEAPVAGGYIDVWTETEGASFAAYGSVLDNETSDPTTVLPQ
ncbi:MAG: DUF4397 domain-containing protein [Thermoanaerobaculales bacterium]|jgi:hypothetical protein|nr:DUF4397 domain-containing protein [Thermoanaerobaculales bacterium]